MSKQEGNYLLNVGYRVCKSSIYLRFALILFVLISGLTIISGCGKEISDEEVLSDHTDTSEVYFNKDLLPYLSIQDGYVIADYAKIEGDYYSYDVYNLREDNETEYRINQYWEVVVMRDENVITTLSVENAEYGGAMPSLSGMVIEADVNFDGKNDILICLGHFGAQMAVAYKCFLSGDGNFVYCPSFEYIPNPSLDSVNKVVRSQYRNWAASHSWSIYRFLDGEFVMAECFTEEPVELDGDREIWTWKDEIFVDNEWQTREYFTEDDFDSETLYNKLYGPDSYWKLGDEWWNTLFNGGQMSDFSIYGD